MLQGAWTGATVLHAGPCEGESRMLLRPIAFLSLFCAAPLFAADQAMDRPTNAEMTRIFEADQGARENPGKIDWSKVRPEDDARRARTGELLDAGRLSSGEDFLHAAFIFQHGDKPADYLKAHLLAMIAIARGQPSATWIASATLDRYLQAIGQPQILGTQFRSTDGAPATQDPFDRALASDSLRVALGVPTLAEQDEQRTQMDARLKAK